MASSFVDEQAFLKNTEALCAFYAEQGLAQVKATTVGVDHLCDEVVAVRTQYELFDAAGTAIAEWEHPYLLRETDEGIRATATVADNEMAAWSARAKPLGQSRKST